MMEKRNSLRQKSLLRGFVYFGGSPSAIECTVRGISETGARLKFKHPPTVAKTLDLYIPIKGQIVSATVSWQRGNEIGIAFAGVRPLPASQEAALANQQATDAEIAKRMQRLENEIVALRQLIKRLQQSVGGKIEAA